MTGSTQAIEELDLGADSVRELNQRLHDVSASGPTHWRVVKEQQATFRPSPGVATLRPGPCTGA